MAIKWDTDVHGFLGGLRREGLRTIEKQYGRPDKHEAVIKTLKQLAKHAQERFEKQKAARDKIIAESITAREAQKKEWKRDEK